MSPLRIWLVGFGTVGKWLAGALDAQAERLGSRYGCAVQVVGIANTRDGFAYRADGLDLAAALAAAGAGRPIGAQRGARTWPSAIEGLRATEADLLVEVTASPPADAPMPTTVGPFGGVGDSGCMNILRSGEHVKTSHHDAPNDTPLTLGEGHRFSLELRRPGL